MRSKLWLLACVPLALAACGENDPDVDNDEAVVLETADTGAMATVPPAGMPMDTGMMAGMDTTAMHNQVMMNAVGNSGVSGTAMLADASGQTQVAVQLTGFQPNSAHAGHIHQGTCDSPGSVVAPLQEVNADATGAGSATSTVQVPLNTVMNGQHIIAYHERGGEDHGAPVVCGSIPAHQM